jgi:hypothetical protein
MTRRGRRNELPGSSSAGRIVGEKAAALAGSINTNPPLGVHLAPASGINGWSLDDSLSLASGEGSSRFSLLGDRKGSKLIRCCRTFVHYSRNR